MRLLDRARPHGARLLYEFRLLKQYMARDFEGCVDERRVIDENFNVVMGMPFSVYYLPYHRCALIALLPTMKTAGARRAALRIVRRNRRRGRLVTPGAGQLPAQADRGRGRACPAERSRCAGRAVL